MRSAYQRQVERIAPPELLNREVELTELTSFCLDEERGPYVWWQAGPWAGKSALLSTLVLNPPPVLSSGGVWLVSFFITARLASQDTREAFTTALTEQLCALLGQELPTGTDDAAREAVLLDLLAQAALVCDQTSGRLVLVVDGLDEDRSVTIGPDAHSIAGLLPGRPPAGMRVIVAGRPNPPIPDDVPDWHPLRDPGIIRLLADSPYARNLQRLGQSELKRLLGGSPVEQDLLGLLTAARGGLSGPDLRELTSADLLTVEQTLHTVSGRTFTRRPARWASEGNREVYLLGHEELHASACHYLGQRRLASYGDRLHAWAETYRISAHGQPSWPPHTPEYLLTGYSRLLATNGDTSRLLPLVIDRARHDRMLSLSGGDSAALAEVKACQDLLLTCPEPDLYALAKLSMHRNQLEARNVNIPPALPGVWAALGQPTRAEALARAMTNPSQKVQALMRVASVMAGDHPDRAREFLSDAEQAAWAISDPFERASALARLAATVAGTDSKGAVRIAHAITDPFHQVDALSRVAQVLARVGSARAHGLAMQAEAIAGSIGDPFQRALALIRVAEAAATVQPERARQLAIQAELASRAIAESEQQGWALSSLVRHVVRADLEWALRIARTINAPRQQAETLTQIAEVVADEDADRALRLLADAERVACTINNSDKQAEALSEIVGRGVRVDFKWAERLAYTITCPYQHAWALAELARGLAGTDPAWAERTARAIADPHQRDRALATLADVVAGSDIDWAERLANAISDQAHKAKMLTGLADVVARSDPEEARRLATEAERIARAITDPGDHAWVLAAVAAVLVEAGPERARRWAIVAEGITRDIADPYRQAQGLVRVAKVAAHIDLEWARGLAADAEQLASSVSEPQLRAAVLSAMTAVVTKIDSGWAERIARSIMDPRSQASLLAQVVAVVAEADPERAERIARSIGEPQRQAEALARVATVLAEADPERARELATSAERFARAVGGPNEQVWALTSVAEAVASIDHEWARNLLTDAELIARGITASNLRGWALAAAARVAAGHDSEWAERIALLIPDPSDRISVLTRVAAAVEGADTERAQTLADRAEVIARAITDPNRQAEALVAVAKVTRPTRACRLLGEAFALGSWLTPLEVLMKMHPQECIRIAEVVSPDASRPSRRSAVI